MMRLALAGALGASLWLTVPQAFAQTPTPPTPTTPASPTAPGDAATGTTTTTPDVTGTTSTTPLGTRTEQIFELTQVVPPGDSGVTGFTVPTGSHLVVTDVLLTNTGSTAACGAGIGRGPSAPVTGVLCVPATSSLELPLMTGIDFTEGQTVQLLNAAATATATAATTASAAPGPISFHLRGVLISGDAGLATTGR